MDYRTMTAVAFGVVTLVLLAWLVLQRRPGSVDEAQAAAGAGGGSGTGGGGGCGATVSHWQVAGQ